MLCEYGYGCCTAPDTKCPHWIGIFVNSMKLISYRRDAPDGGYYG